MKKVLRLLLVLTLVITCIACNKKVEPFDLKDEYYEESIITDLEYEDFEKLLSDKESFVAFIYLPGCSSCAEFRETLDEFQKDNKLTIYSLQIKYAQQNDTLKEKIKYAPSFVVYKDGELVSYLDSESNDDMKYYQSADEFKNWLTKYINLK